MKKMKIFLSALLVASFLAILPCTVIANGLVVDTFHIFNDKAAKSIKLTSVLVITGEYPPIPAPLDNVGILKPGDKTGWVFQSNNPECGKDLNLEIVYNVVDGAKDVKANLTLKNPGVMVFGNGVKGIKGCKTGYARTGGGPPVVGGE